MGLKDFLAWLRKDGKPKIKTVENFLENNDPWQSALFLLDTYGNKRDYTDLTASPIPELPEEIITLMRDQGLEALFISELCNNGKKQLLAIKMLGSMGTEKSLPALLNSLAKNDAEISLIAKEALLKFDLRKYDQLLLNNFLKAPARMGEIILSLGEKGMELIKGAFSKATKEEQLLLLEILGEFQNINNSDFLIAKSQSEDEDVRYAALLALSKLNLPSLKMVFIRSLDDENWKIRVEAIKWIGKNRVLEAHPILFRILNEDAEWTVKVAAENSLRLLDTEV